MGPAEVTFNFHLELKKMSSIATILGKISTILIGSWKYNMYINLIESSGSCHQIIPNRNQATCCSRSGEKTANKSKAACKLAFIL